MVKEPMEHKSKKQIGYSIVTYRVRLYDRHFAWLKETKELYGKVTAHFLSVLQKETGLLEQSDFLLLREIEKICIGTKEMKAAGQTPAYPLTDFPKIPLYFRRSAINAAIDLARKNCDKAEDLTNVPMVFYKGMYQNFTNHTIELKLFHNEKWVWVTYPFHGREFPAEAERLSPVLVLEKKAAYLEVPVSLEVTDVRTIKERMETEETICAVAFPDSDVLAVAVLLNRNGEEQACHFFRGGKAKEEQRQKLLARMQTSKKSRGKTNGTQSAEQSQSSKKITVQNKPKENASLYKRMHELNHYYVHNISRQILDYCLEQKIKVLVVPNYELGIDFSGKKYLKTDSYRWLGRSIIKHLKYKAFPQGIVVTSVPPYHISDCCSECGATIRKYNEGHTAGVNYYGGRLFLCPNGHKGNTARNTARNVGKHFLAYYEQKKSDSPASNT